MKPIVLGTLLMISGVSSAVACGTNDNVSFPASQFASSLNVCVDCLAGYGPDLITNNSGADQPNRADYEFSVPSEGSYRMRVEYAAAQSRPVRIIINDRLVKNGGLGEVTGGWQAKHAAYQTEGIFELKAGENKLRLDRGSVFPHIRTILFECAD